jgi:hypothetical protein
MKTERRESLENINVTTAGIVSIAGQPHACIVNADGQAHVFANIIGEVVRINRPSGTRATGAGSIKVNNSFFQGLS